MNAIQHDLDLKGLALLELGRTLRNDGYAFVTVTPETHRRIDERAAAHGHAHARTLRDVFGWSRPFDPKLMPRRMLELLMAAGQVEASGGLLRSKVRFSTVGNQLFVHSAYPTVQQDAVFFGPDTYRFCSLVQRWAKPQSAYTVDVCGGGGAGGIALAKRSERVVIADVNRTALDFAAVNAALAGVSLDVIESDLLERVDGSPDLIIANPPYMRDTAGRVYRDGGGERGEGLSLRIVREGLSRLSRGGELILYTGTAIVEGVDALRDALTELFDQRQLGRSIRDFTYEELDPDVFGEELSAPGYQVVDRIAVVGLHVRMC
jgi:release factor glutamine methyltransferase